MAQIPPLERLPGRPRLQAHQQPRHITDILCVFDTALSLQRSYERIYTLKKFGVKSQKKRFGARLALNLDKGLFKY